MLKKEYVSSFRNQLKSFKKDIREYSLYFLVTVVLSLLLFVGIRINDDNQKDRYINLLTEQFYTECDTMFSNLQFASNVLINNEFFIQSLEQTNNNSRYLELCSLIRSVCGSNDYVGEIYVICPRQDHIYTQNGYLTYDSLGSVLSAVGATYEELDESVYSSRQEINLLNSNGYAPYIISPVTDESGQNIGSILITLKMREYLNTIYNEQYYFCCLFREETGDYLCSRFSTTRQAEPDWYDSSYVSDFLGASVSCSYIENEGYTYMVAILNSDYSSSSRYLIFIFALFFLLFITFGIIYTWRIAINRYREISTLEDALFQSTNEPGPYEDIIKQASKALNDFKVQKDENERINSSNALRDIIYGRYNVSDINDNLIKTARIPVGCDYYYLVSFYLTNINELLPNNMKRSNVSGMINIMITTFLREMSEEKIRFTSCTDHYNIFVVFGSGDGSETEFRDSLCSICEKVHSFLLENYSITTTIVASSLFTDIKQLNDAYEKLQQTNTFLTSIDNTRPVVFQEMLESDNVVLLDNSYIRQENILLNVLISGKFSLIPGMVSTIISEDITPLTTKRDIANERFISLISLLAEGVIASNIPGAPLDEYADRLRSATSVSQLNEVTSEIFTDLDERQRNTQTDDYILDKACRYIDDNLSNMNLSVSSICDSCSISFQFLTRLFRKKFNRTIAEYISHCRVEKAKELLRSTSLTVADIAAEVGYSSVDTLTRNFKKLEGLTPTEYRKF